MRIFGSEKSQWYLKDKQTRLAKQGSDLRLKDPIYIELGVLNTLLKKYLSDAEIKSRIIPKQLGDRLLDEFKKKQTSLDQTGGKFVSLEAEGDNFHLYNSGTIMTLSNEDIGRYNTLSDTISLGDGPINLDEGPGSSGTSLRIAKE